MFKIEITEECSGEPTESWVLPYTYKKVFPYTEENLQSAIEFAEKLVNTTLVETHASEVYRLGLNITFNIQGEGGEILFTSRPYRAVDFYGVTHRVL